jgi:hypothetical protein
VAYKYQKRFGFLLIAFDLLVVFFLCDIRVHREERP